MPSHQVLIGYAGRYLATSG